MLLDPACAVCGSRSARIEVLAPGELPDGYETWDTSSREVYERYQDVAAWRLLYEDPGGGNGYGDSVTADEAAVLIDVFTSPVDVDRLDEAGVDGGVCRPCGEFYCRTHWNVSPIEYGRCPRGHGKTIDPHWHPDLD